jgi:hypothetical protein
MTEVPYQIGQAPDSQGFSLTPGSPVIRLARPSVIKRDSLIIKNSGFAGI